MTPLLMTIVWLEATLMALVVVAESPCASQLLAMIHRPEAQTVCPGERSVSLSPRLQQAQLLSPRVGRVLTR